MAVGVPLHRFIFALGIPQVGITTAKLLAGRYGSLEAFRAAAVAEVDAAAAAAAAAVADTKVDEAETVALVALAVDVSVVPPGDDDLATEVAAIYPEVEAMEEEEGQEKEEAMTDIVGIGPVVSATVGEFWAEQANASVVDDMLAAGVVVLRAAHVNQKPREEEAAGVGAATAATTVAAAAFIREGDDAGVDEQRMSDESSTGNPSKPTRSAPLAGMHVVVTGTVPGMTREAGRLGFRV